jgi:hypothetical protein
MDADKTQNELILAAEKQRGQEQFERDKARVDFALKADRQEKELAIKARTAARPKANA